MSGNTVFHGGGIDAAALRYGRPADEWLDLSTGINPCPPALPVLEPLIWQRLPDSRLILDARQMAARYYGSGSVLPQPAAGTQVLIRALAAQADRARRVAILSPTYDEYRSVFDDEGFGVDLIKDLKEISDLHGVVVIVNPNNPDGRVVDRQTLLELAQRLRTQSSMLIVDEAFGDLDDGASVTSAVENNDNLVVLRSFGKFFGYAGLRLAFAIAGASYSGRIERFVGPWPVSGPALAIGGRLMAGDIEALRETIKERRQALGAVLDVAGLSVVGGTELFALIEFKRAGQLFEHLARAGILTRAFDYRPDWLRIGLFAEKSDGLRLAAALKAFG